MNDRGVPWSDLQYTAYDQVAVALKGDAATRVENELAVSFDDHGTNVAINIEDDPL
jgi:hypothetical protein